MTDNSGLTSRQLIQRLFTQGVVPRLPFLPWVFTHAARLEQIPVSRMFRDPNQYARAIQNAQKLYGYDAVANVFDPSLEAEACGCPITWGDDYELPSVSAHPLSVFNRIPETDIADIERKGRLPVVLEATQRIKTVLGRTTAIVGVVTGPLALASRLTGTDITKELAKDPEETKRVLDFAGQVTVRVCRAYGELEPDIIAIVDDGLLRLSLPHYPLAISYLGPLCSLARFYNAHPVLVTTGDGGANLEILSSLNLDGAVVSNVALSTLKQAKFKANLVQGVAIPPPVLLAPDETMRQFVSQCLESGGETQLFLTTASEVPAETDPERMHALGRIISSFSCTS